MISDRLYSAAVHNDYLVGVLDRGYTLRDDYFRGIGYLLGKRAANKRVGLGINCARGVVENEYLRLFEQGASYTKPLLLTARDVGTALSYVGVVAVGE